MDVGLGKDDNLTKSGLVLATTPRASRQQG